MNRRSRRTREEHRELALAYLAAVSADEVRLRRVVAAHIERVLEATDHNLSLAADLLGMNRRSLQRYARRKQEPKAKAKRRVRKKKR
jgi:ActR/RegA family two-component response regulator